MNNPLEKVTADAYNEFYEKNKTLLRTNPVEYWHEARLYKERKVIEYKIKHGLYEAKKK